MGREKEKDNPEELEDGDGVCGTVDAFEVFTTLIILSRGLPQEKMNALFTIFCSEDYSAGSLFLGDDSGAGAGAGWTLLADGTADDQNPTADGVGGDGAATLQAFGDAWEWEQQGAMSMANTVAAANCRVISLTQLRRLVQLAYAGLAKTVSGLPKCPKAALRLYANHIVATFCTHVGPEELDAAEIALLTSGGAGRGAPSDSASGDAGAPGSGLLGLNFSEFSLWWSHDLAVRKVLVIPSCGKCSSQSQSINDGSQSGSISAGEDLHSDFVSLREHGILELPAWSALSSHFDLLRHREVLEMAVYEDEDQDIRAEDGSDRGVDDSDCDCDTLFDTVTVPEGQWFSCRQPHLESWVGEAEASRRTGGARPSAAALAYLEQGGTFPTGGVTVCEGTPVATVKGRTIRWPNGNTSVIVPGRRPKSLVARLKAQKSLETGAGADDDTGTLTTGAGQNGAGRDPETDPTVDDVLALHDVSNVEDTVDFTASRIWLRGREIFFRVRGARIEWSDGDIWVLSQKAEYFTGFTEVGL